MELFISDLDGTLLNGNAEVTEFTRDTLNRLMAKGLNFTAATARTLASAGKILARAFVTKHGRNLTAAIFCGTSGGMEGIPALLTLVDSPA